MKRMLAGLALALGTALLSGCYDDPGYSYVRGNGYQGDAYYGEGPAVVYRPDYDSGYYGSGYYGPGWGYGGCCYSSGVSVGIGATWYPQSRHYRGRDRDWRGERYRDRDRDRDQDQDRDRDRDRDDRRRPERHDWRDRRDRD